MDRRGSGWKLRRSHALAVTLIALIAPAVLTGAACGTSDEGASGDGSSESAADGASVDVHVDAGVSPTKDASVANAQLDGDTAVDASRGFDAGASVVQHHNHATRDGFYLDPALTKSSVATTLRLWATWPITGPTYAAPLFVDGAIGGKDAVIVATEQNTVYAFDANGSDTIWKTPPLGTPVPLAKLMADPGCGNIDPLGVTGTPYVDLRSRTIYLDAMTTPDDGTTQKHLVFALSLDDGSVRKGWPVDLDGALGAAPIPFHSNLQNQRGALALVDGILYVPFGGHAGDCGDYHGWLVGVDVQNPTNVHGWATPASKGGAWAVAGVSSDGVSMYMTTGNTAGASTDASDWAGGEAVVRFGRGPIFSGAAADFFAPANWPDLDFQDLDLGGSAAVLADVPGATPSALIVALGKDGNVYLIDRNKLGGVGHQVASVHVATYVINGAATVFRTPAGTFVTFRIESGTGVVCPNGQTGNVLTVKIGATNPPTITPVWCSDRGDLSPPIASASSSNGADALVWAIGGVGLYAYDGETGTPVFTGGTQSDMHGYVHYFQTPIIAKGRVYVAGGDHVYAYAP